MIRILFLSFILFFGFYITGFWLEGLGSSGRLVGTISTYPGTYKSPWSRVMAKNPPGRFFLPSTVVRCFNPPEQVEK